MQDSLRPFDDNDLRPGIRVGDYVVSGRVGMGGMATVYAADHPLIGRRVAIKVMRADLGTSPDALERFLQEARAIIAINHPNIVDVFTFGALADGRSYFVMELLQGRTLAEALDTDGPLPFKRVCAALIEMCDGLEAAHRAGVIHRDLKPQNVFLVAPTGKVKLLDFGIAKLINRPEPRVQHTRPGMTIGTPDYISPEQARGRDVDGRADVYSLGVVAFEALTGQLPFEADNAADMMAMHLCRAPRRLTALRPSLPPALDALIEAMLAKDPAARPSLAEIRGVCMALERQAVVPVTTTRELNQLAAEKIEQVLPRGLRRTAAAVLGLAALGLCGALVGRTEPLRPALIAATTPMAPAAVHGMAVRSPSTLEPVPEPPVFGLLVVRATSRVRVTIDGVEQALERGILRARIVGHHHLRVSAPGFRTVSYSVDVMPGHVVEVPVTLRPIPRRRAVAKAPIDDFHTIDPWRGR